jgi:hypothetical protein
VIGRAAAASSATTPIMVEATELNLDFEVTRSKRTVARNDERQGASSGESAAQFICTCKEQKTSHLRYAPRYSELFSRRAHGVCTDSGLYSALACGRA